MKFYLEVLKKYAVFSGRARRKEYWMFMLFNIIIMITTYIIDYLLKTTISIKSIYTLAVMLPTIAVSVRRLQDIGKSGWWFFITLIPLVGGIWFFILTLKDSQPGENIYGANLKEI